MATTVQSHTPEQSQENYNFPRPNTLDNGNTTIDILAEQKLLQLHISQILQTSLELEVILSLFYKELNKHAGINSLGFRNEQNSISLNFGDSAKHSCHYSLQVNGSNLGDLILTRAKRFSANDLQLIESLTGSLVCPIRNAFLYREAQLASLKDPLTQIGNRAAFNTAIDREASLAQRHNQALSIMVIDIDYFKRINDSYGHSTGDTVLINIAKTLLECCRESDTSYRFGGEEFVIILYQTDVSGSAMIAERIRKTIESNAIESNSNLIDLTVSIGIATMQASETPTELFNRADKALYTAKANGRNQVARAS